MMPYIKMMLLIVIDTYAVDTPLLRYAIHDYAIWIHITNYASHNIIDTYIIYATVALAAIHIIHAADILMRCFSLLRRH